jgi:hypothetical protein
MDRQEAEMFKQRQWQELLHMSITGAFIEFCCNRLRWETSIIYLSYHVMNQYYYYKRAAMYLLVFRASFIMNWYPFVLISADVGDSIFGYTRQNAQIQIIVSKLTMYKYIVLNFGKT